MDSEDTPLVLAPDPQRPQVSWTTYQGPGAVDSAVTIGITAMTIGCAFLGGMCGTIESPRDQFLVFTIILEAALLTHTGNIWTLTSCYLGIDPLWPADALLEYYSVLGFMWAVGFSLIGA
jgi:hypothetical protein